MKLPSNKLPNTMLDNFGIVHNLPSSLLHIFGVMNTYNSINSVLNMHQGNTWKDHH